MALVVAIQAINTTTLAAFTDAIDDLAGTAALQVRGQGPFDEAIADAIRGLPGVDHAVPILTDTFFAIDPPAAGEALAVYAADVSDGHAVKTLHLVKSGEQSYAIPMAALERVVRTAAQPLASLGRTPMLELDGEAFPYLELGPMLGQQSARRKVYY